MEVSQLNIKGCWIFKPKVFPDSRGLFFEWFNENHFKKNLNFDFKLAQANCSISHKGVIRGIHFARLPPGQSKFVTCFAGSVLDVVVDLRKKSKTFGKWEFVELNSKEPKMLYIPSGIGHGFISLEDNSIFVYLCDQKYNPENEFDINPLDVDLGINWPSEITPILSSKDLAAPSFNSMKSKFPDIF